MGRPKFVPIAPEPLERWRELLGAGWGEVEIGVRWAREALAGRAIWHVNSTARGGGVAEMLHAMLPYARDAGIDTRWVALRERPEFFRVTKRLHNRLHGERGDGGPLGAAERRLYESTLAVSGEEIAALCQAGDVVYLHDPQTAGLAPRARRVGLKVLWRCHIGTDSANEAAREAWDFLRPYVEAADAVVFSRAEFAWEGLDPARTHVMPPVIDPFTPKNQDLPADTAAAILCRIGLGADGGGGAPSFVRADHTPGRVERRAELEQDGPLPDGAPVLAQVSRWDRLKDPLGVLRGFALHLDVPDAHLVLAGPQGGAVADDPESDAAYAAVAAARGELGPGTRRRVHLARLPMHDLDENGAMVNAIQRRADVVVQKSLAEGFGLTVAEAMWKRRPVVASRVGGIRDQVIDGETGVLVADPRDLVGFAAAVRELLAEPQRAARMGEAGRRRVRERYLSVPRMLEYLTLLAGLLGLPAPPLDGAGR